MPERVKPAPSGFGHPGRVLDFDLVRVFVDEGGDGGWPVAVFLAGEAVERGARSGMTAALDVAASTFVDDRHRGCMETYTSESRLPIALPGMLAAAWLLELSGFELSEVRSHGGRLPTWREGDLTWARADAAWGRPLTRLALDSPGAVDDAAAAPGARQTVHVWAWEDEPRGIVRSRLLSPGPAAGAGDDAVAVGALAMALGRPVTIRHDGGVIAARPGDGGTVELGARVAVVVATDYESFSTAP